MTKNDRKSYFNKLSKDTFQMFENDPLGKDKDGNLLPPESVYQRVYQRTVIADNAELRKRIIKNDCLVKAKYIADNGCVDDVLGMLIAESFGLPEIVSKRITTLSDLFDMADRIGISVHVLRGPNGYSASVLDRIEDIVLMKMHDISNVRILTNTIIDTVKEWLSRNKSRLRRALQEDS